MTYITRSGKKLLIRLKNILSTIVKAETEIRPSYLKRVKRHLVITNQMVLVLEKGLMRTVEARMIISQEARMALSFRSLTSTMRKRSLIIRALKEKMLT